MSGIITIRYEDFKYKITYERTGEVVECSTYLTASNIVQYLLCHFETTD